MCEYDDVAAFDSHVDTSWKRRCLGCRDTSEGLLTSCIAAAAAAWPFTVSFSAKRMSTNLPYLNASKHIDHFCAFIYGSSGFLGRILMN